MNAQAAMLQVASPPPLQIQELLRPAAFPHPVEHLELRETPTFWVILTGPFAYKVKKPITLGFQDLSTLEERRRSCDTELRLNRRYAAEIYIDVVPITRRQNHIAVGAGGPVIDYAVRMNQFDAANELPALLAANQVSLREIVMLAELLADFHMRAPIAGPIGNCKTSTHPKTQLARKAVLGNLAQLIAHSTLPEPTDELGALIDWTHDKVQSLESALKQREDSGCIRECHGELHAANIIRWQGRLIPCDGVELDPQRRWIDVMDDVAFLLMEFVGRERRDLALTLLSRYLEITGDYEGVRLLQFYAVYRALLRAKVDTLFAEQLPLRSAEFRALQQQRIHEAAAWITPQRPILILMHGPSGSGKSWLSEQLIAPLAAVRVRSDLERKRLAGIKPHLCAAAGLWQGIYSSEFTQKTYDRLADCAKHCLEAGFNTIVDAAFLSSTDRERFRELAAQLGTAFVIVSCQSDAGTLSARLARRSRSYASDAHLAVLDAQLRTIEPFSESEQPHVMALDTSDWNAIQSVVTSVTSIGGSDVGKVIHGERSCPSS